MFILCLTIVVLETLDIYKNGNILLRQSGITMLIMGNVPVRQEYSFKSKDSQIKQTEWDTYFNWIAESSKGLEHSEMALLKDSLQKANEKWKTREVYLKQKTKTAMNSTAPLYPP